MTRVRLLAGIVTALAALALPASAVAAPASTRFAVTGFEYAFTPTVGYFAGRATGNAGDRGAWNARVVHEPLGSDSTPVTGGSFQMVTRSAAGQYDFITGAFKGGTIVTKDAGPNCTNQLYHVTGMIGNVTTSTTTGGTGTFDVILTHYRVLLFGRCITYSASVGGTVSFVY